MAYWSMLINVKFSSPLAIGPFPNFHLKSNESISQREALLYLGHRYMVKMISLIQPLLRLSIKF